MKDTFTEASPRNRKRLLERLDHMVTSGQVTQAEAQRLRAMEDRRRLLNRSAQASQPALAMV